MKSNKLKIFLIAIILISAVAAFFHLSGREEIPENAVKITYKDEVTYIDLEEIDYTLVKGVRVNGKGDKIEIEQEGILVSDLLKEENITSFTSISVVADDSYSASVEYAEIMNGEDVYFLYEEEALRLLVFSDKNSKRSVSNVVEIIVE